jgi:hypothetical protein
MIAAAAARAASDERLDGGNQQLSPCSGDVLPWKMSGRIHCSAAAESSLSFALQLGSCGAATLFVSSAFFISLF